MWSLVTSEGLVKQILDTQEDRKVAKIFMGQEDHATEPEILKIAQVHNTVKTMIFLSCFDTTSPRIQHEFHDPTSAV